MISVVVAVHNGAKTLQRCIDSFVKQTYPYKELIIMDGGSTDGTLNILCDNDKQIGCWKSEPDNGISHAWNKALKQVTGDWILFLGADDELHDSQVLEKFAQLQKMQTARLLYGQVVMSQSGKIQKVVGEPWSNIQSIVMRAENKIPHQGLFHARELFSKYGGFDETLGITADYDFILRCIKEKVTPCFMDDFTVARMQKGGVSNAYSSTIFTYLEFGKSRQQNKFKVYSLQYLWLLLKGFLKYMIDWVSKGLKWE